MLQGANATCIKSLLRHSSTCCHPVGTAPQPDLGEEVNVRSRLKRYPRLEGLTKSGYRKFQGTALGHRLVRREIVMRYYRPRLQLARQWIPRRTENDNFYYELTPRNVKELASLVAIVSGTSIEAIERYVRELQDDTEIRDHIRQLWRQDPKMRDAQLGFGRRIGWYAFVRALKPKIVVETGVHHGVGACVITRALMRNAIEGHDGYYFGTDIDRRAGVLLTGEYSTMGRILYGDSLDSLRSLNQSVDIFINDSDHSSNYERLEYQIINPHLADTSLILGDNSHVSTELADFSRENGRPYIFFHEEPDSHWYPGAGIGISPSRVPLTGC